MSAEGRPGPSIPTPHSSRCFASPGASGARGPGSGTDSSTGSGTDSTGSGTDWLVVIDPQNIFASPGSAWGSPFFAEVMPRIRSLADAFGERVIVTRWMPTADRSTSWGDYFAAWPFADQPAEDELFDLVPDAAPLSSRPTLDMPTFGKWGPELEGIVGHGGRVVLAGVSTDCCVLSTALAAADAGAHVTVATDACAGSTAENHAAAVHVMGLYPPQITLATTADVLAGR